MAGVGFELKRLFKKKSFLDFLKASFYSILIVVGPMMLCIILISFFNKMLYESDFTYTNIQIFLSSCTYAFVFSNVFSSAFSMIVSRYVSDRIYSGEYEKIGESYIGVLVLVVLFNGIIGIVFLCFSPIILMDKLLIYTFYMLLSIVWVQNAYISAIKDYISIFKSIFFAIIISGITFFIFVILFKIKSIDVVFLSLNIGFFFCFYRINIIIRNEFGFSISKTFKFLYSFFDYPELMAIGFFLNMGLYVSCIIIWISKFGTTIAGTFRIANLYDLPMFYAVLTIVPALVIFTVSFETTFYDRYKAYYNNVTNGGTLSEIEYLRVNLESFIYEKITHVTEFQLFIAIICILLGERFLQGFGLNSTEIDIYSIIVMGCLEYVIFVFIILILLYFDIRNKVLRITMTFFLCNLVLTIVTVFLGVQYIGLGFFLSSLIGLLYGLYELQKVLSNLNYLTFCSQPIYTNKNNRVSNFIKRIINTGGEINEKS